MAYGTPYGMRRALLSIVRDTEKSIIHTVIRFASASTFRLYHVTGIP